VNQNIEEATPPLVGHVVHRVKEHPRYFEDLIRFPRPRAWELRDNNRDFKTGDGLRVVEWDPATEKETGRWALCRISWTSEEHGRVHLMPQGLILLGVEVLQLEDGRPLEQRLEDAHDTWAALKAALGPCPALRVGQPCELAAGHPGDCEFPWPAGQP